jgi:cysteinyl-tRNA synthetase
LDPEAWFRLPRKVFAEDALRVSVSESAVIAPSLSDAEADAKVQQRAAARAAKNWAESDRLRDELAAAGVIVEDKPGGKPTWRRK